MLRLVLLVLCIIACNPTAKATKPLPPPDLRVEWYTQLSYWNSVVKFADLKTGVTCYGIVGREGSSLRCFTKEEIQK